MQPPEQPRRPDRVETGRVETGRVETWSVTAVNLPEHAGNAIHTDLGARAAGFPSALVAGVTTYAYLTHPCVAAWGEAWLRSGGGTLALKAPVFAGDTVDLVPTVNEHGADIAAVCRSQERNPRATFAAERQLSGPVPERREGEALASLTLELGDYYGADYGWRAGDDLEIYLVHDIVHPAVWLAIANLVYTTHLVRGSWIHTRSRIRHHEIARVGDPVDVHATVIERFARNGERVVTEVVIERRRRRLVTIEHEAIIDLSE